MQFIKSRILKETDEKLEFISKTKEILGIDYPPEYFDQGFIRAFETKEGELIGGYALIMEGPFRTIGPIPQENKDLIKDKKLFEITALWLSREVNCGFASCQFWYTCAREIAAQSHKDYIVYSYDLDKVKLKELYALGKPSVLYQGKIKKIQGMKADAFESVEIASPKVIKYLPLYALPNFISKFVFKRKTYFKDVDFLSYFGAKR